MADHDGFSPLVDQRPVNLSVALHPFLATEGIDTREDMLVPFIHTVTREVLDRDCHTAFIRRVQITRTAREDHLRV